MHVYQIHISSDLENNPYANLYNPEYYYNHHEVENGVKMIFNMKNSVTKH